LELAKMSQESFFNRRSYEWKVAFGLWIAIGAITYIGIEKAASLGPTTPSRLGWLYVAIAVSWIFFWQWPTRLAFMDDKDFKHYYMHMAEGREARWPPDQPKSWRRVVCILDENGRWVCSWRAMGWAAGQTLFTIAVLIGSWIAVSGAVAGSATDSGSKVELKASGNTVKVQTEATAK
jgi:hypothetical protein